VLGHPRGDRGQIEHLTSLDAGLRHIGQSIAASTTHGRFVARNLVRRRDLRQRRSWMPGLATGLTAVLTSQ
jgi:hypothetical protein